MCVEHSKICSCGQNCASLFFRDEILPGEVVRRIYCPRCSADVTHDERTMLRDNGWVIEYDMEIVNFMGRKLRAEDATPAYIFDEGFCTWSGIYPTDRADSVSEREGLSELARIDKRRYIEEFKNWGAGRMARLELEGWRKAVGKR